MKLCDFAKSLNRIISNEEIDLEREVMKGKEKNHVRHKRNYRRAMY